MHAVFHQSQGPCTICCLTIVPCAAGCPSETRSSPVCQKNCQTGDSHVSLEQTAKLLIWVNKPDLAMRSMVMLVLKKYGGQIIRHQTRANVHPGLHRPLLSRISNLRWVKVCAVINPNANYWSGLQATLTAGSCVQQHDICCCYKS